MWIKICGTTNLEDAIAAVEAGAEALGFIFAPSPRRISPKDAARIIRELPAKVEKVGVFVNQHAAIIRRTRDEASLTGIQLHGDEDAEFVRELRQALAPEAMRVIKAVKVREGFESGIAEFEGDGAPDAFLLDSGSGDARGGTGKRFDWEQHAGVIRLLSKRHRIVVGGGLTPETVGSAIAQFAPYGVDVVSGVEREPGHKDHAKVKAFIAAARQAAHARSR